METKYLFLRDVPCLWFLLPVFSYKNLKHQPTKVRNTMSEEKAKPKPTKKGFALKYHGLEVNIPEPWIEAGTQALLSAYEKWTKPTPAPPPPPQYNESTQEYQVRPCAICYDRFPNGVLIPCGHVLCLECGDHLNLTRCPFCQASFTRMVRIFM